MTTGTATDALTPSHTLLFPAAQARELPLHWRPVGELAPGFARGFSLAVTDEADADADRVRQTCARGIARCLDATAPSKAAT